MAYTKKGEARYIAHLDLTRVFDRALRRAQVEVAYSEGFNPHPKIAFGPPLPVGVASLREFVDLDLKAPAEVGKDYLDQVAAKLQKQLPEGIEILDWVIRPQGDKAITAVLNLARYQVQVPFLKTVTQSALQEACQSWLARDEALGIRFQKGRKTERNLRPFVQMIRVLDLKGELEATMGFDMAIGNAGSVRPVEVLQSLAELEGIPLDLPGVVTGREGLYIRKEDGTLSDPLEVLKLG